MEPMGIERHRRRSPRRLSDLRLRRIASQTGEIFPGIQAIRGSRGKKVFTFFETLRIFFLCKGMNPKEGKLLKETNP
jgi:hypothetical protein